MMKKMFDLAITPSHMLRILLAIACAGLAKAPTKEPQAILIFQNRNGIVYSEFETNAHNVPEDSGGLSNLLSKALMAPILEKTQFTLKEHGFVETKVPLVIPMISKGSPRASSTTFRAGLSWADLTEEEEEENGEEKLNNKFGMTASPIVETITKEYGSVKTSQYALTTAKTLFLTKSPTERYVFEVDLIENVPLELLMEWNFVGENINFVLALRSYNFYTATSMFREGDHTCLTLAMYSINEVLKQYGLTTQMDRLIEEAEISGTGRRAIPLGEISLQSYIRLCKDLRRIDSENIS